MWIGSYDCCIYCLDIFNYKCITKIHSDAPFATSPLVFSVCTSDHNGYTSTETRILCANLKGIICHWRLECTIKNDAAQSDFDLLESEVPDLLWSFSCDSPIFASPITTLMPNGNDGIPFVVANPNQPYKQMEQSRAHEACGVQQSDIENMIVIVACADASINGLRVSDGVLIWSQKLGAAIFSWPCLSKLFPHRLVIGCHDSNVYCLDLFDGSILWNTETPSSIFSTCCIVDQYVVAVSSCGVISVLNIDTGQKLLDHSLPSQVFSSIVPAKPYFEYRSDELKKPCNVWSVQIVVGCRDNKVYSMSLCANTPEEN